MEKKTTAEREGNRKGQKSVKGKKVKGAVKKKREGKDGELGDTLFGRQ